MMRSALVLLTLSALAVSACHDDRPASSASASVPSVVASVAPPSASDGAPDPLGPKPDVPPAPAYVPPVPVVFEAANGIKVWLLERHTLPLVSVTVTVPIGASSDPKGKGGVALATASMLEDGGAGARDAIGVAREVDMLGATLGTSADADASRASLTVLKRNAARGFALLGDVVAHPRFAGTEWKRVRDLWLNDLKSRASDPSATAHVVQRVALYGEGHPYAHPSDGTVASATGVSLDDVQKFYAAAWRPERVIVVIAGDVDRREATTLVDSAFGTWKARADVPALPILTPAAPKGPWPRVVLVDRPDAPQSVIAAIRVGPSAGDADVPALWRVNEAIGGSFTSRLNQDLREEHGWSYGARAGVSRSRGAGMVTATAAVHTEKTGDALKAMLADLDAFAKDGLTADEMHKTRSQARGELVQVFETLQGAVARLALDASLGLPPDYERTASERRDSATREDLARLAASYFSSREAVIVIVGPRAQIESAISAAGLPAPEIRDADGNVRK
jgi:zinc protease